METVEKTAETMAEVRPEASVEEPENGEEKSQLENVEIENGEKVETEEDVDPEEVKEEANDEEDVRPSNKRKSSEEQHDEPKKPCMEEPTTASETPGLAEANSPPEEMLLVPLEPEVQTKLEREVAEAEIEPIEPSSLDTISTPEIEPTEPSLDTFPTPEIEQCSTESPENSRLSAHNLQTDETLPDESPQSESKEDDSLDIHEKLREMDEISVKPVSKSTESSSSSSPAASTSSSKRKESESEVSVEIKKKGGETEDSKRITNLRKNIREVMDENQLDATTLAAQRQESERLARVQVQQKIIRELQRQMAAERQNNRTQNRVLSLLQGQTSIVKTSSATTGNQAPNSSDMYVVKGVASEVTFKGSSFVDVEKISGGNLTPSVSIAPVARGKMTDYDEDDELMTDEESLSDMDEKKEVVTIVDSSSENDCIVLSDDDEEFEEEPEDDPHNSGLHVKDAYNIPDEKGRVLINIGHPEDEEDIFLAPQIARIIKPHQIGGVRFLYDNIIESTERFSTSTGFGCILAHSMGLGKTLQIVCFCDIFLRHTNSKSILCILPINTLQNWLAEFNMWLPEDPEKSPMAAHGEVRPRNFKIFVLSDQQKTLTARSKVIAEWNRVGGVLLVGYELFRLLSLKLANKKKKSKKEGEKEKPETESHKRMMEDIHSALVRPGPDLVMCDEGHRIKNSHASISVALKQIRSKRRIVLTGYPLQNNLMEYWCMVDFVRPNYLGTKTEFSNMFERPIQNGQCIDSTPQDIKLMRYRAHVLHSLLVGFVQRRSHVVLQNTLPQKEEYVILVRMTDFQRKLYTTFMNDVVRTKAVPNPLKAFAVCCKIWNHPDVLYNFLKKREADLDLELEEVETETNSSTSTMVSSATSSTTSPSSTTRGRKKGTPNKPKGVKKGDKTIPAVEVQPNQGKVPNQVDKAEDKSPEKTEIKLESPSEEVESKPATPASDNSPPAVPQLVQPPPQHPFVPNPPTYQSNYNQYNPYEYENYYGQQYGSMYPPNALPPPHLQHAQYPGGQPYEQPPAYGSQNNYWQNSYYGYNNSNAMNLDPYSQIDASYASLVPKATESFEKSKPPSAEAKTSEIVDLDTKEIKTVEPPPPPPPPPPAPIVEETDDAKETETKVKDEQTEPKEEDDASPPPSLEKEKEKEPTKGSKDDGIPYDWAVELMKGYVPDLLENSPKMEIFFQLLEESIRLGDRILVFSQSLLTLNLIERFLHKTVVPGFDYHWAKNTTYFRLDGSTSAMDREKLINEFNANPHVHLFLVSTRAGSLGINLVGANRVVVFDASWNPCHDTQAVCRVYRYGQKKPCFVYRIVMDNCLEKKIYDRQINKQGMSDRVVDECNPDAHLSMKEVTNLCYDNEEENDIKDLSECKDKYLDVVMQKVIELYSKWLSKEPFHHESLLVDRKEKKLSQAEKRLAQRGYEMEKRAAAKPAYVYHSMGTQYRVMKTPDGAIVHRPVASVRPMQAELGDKSHITRPGGVRPTRWIPAEVWQRQGMTAQEMTLPLDVVIPTSSGDKSNIVLKAGQKVMVLKSPKGIYMQLETGKIIAIRTSLKMGQQNKEKAEDSEAGTSNVTNTDDLLMKPATKGSDHQSSPVHQSSNSNFMSTTGKQGFSFESSRNKSNGNPVPPLQFKGTAAAGGLVQPNRTFTTSNTNNSKNFNVQNLIDGKTSNGQQTASVYSHSKGPDLLPSETNRNMSASPATISKTNLFNAATKMHYPRSNYSFTNALKQQQHQPPNHGGSSQSLLANVKPQAHENRMWEPSNRNHAGSGGSTGGSTGSGNSSSSSKAATAGSGETGLQTITIDDDIEPPLREKVVYKPNLIERKTKGGNVKNTPQNFGAKSNKNTPSQNAGNFKGSSDNTRQLQNVKPYNRQYQDPNSETARSKATADEISHSQPPATASVSSDVKKTNNAPPSSRGKMPSIRNIPAPYPSICVPSSSASLSHPSVYNPPSYTQSNGPIYSQDGGQQQQQQQHSNQTTASSYGEQNTQRQESSEYSSYSRSQHKTDTNLSKSSSSSGMTASSDKSQSSHQPPTSSAQPQTQSHQQAPSNQTATAQSEQQAGTTNSSSELQYPNYSSSANVNSYPSAEPTYTYPRTDTTAYQSYSDMYSSATPNPYVYPPVPHQAAAQQANNYPYNPYYDPQMYGSSVNPSYGSAASIPSQQHSQYHYPTYQPPPGVPSTHPNPSDPYGSYYNYPPYPPQTGQWQQ